MTDNEIIKALHCCISLNAYGGDCDEGCPLCDADCCGSELLTHTLDLINRQQAEIDVLKTNCLSMAQSMPNMAKAERYEAIKEFAERWKAEVTNRYEDIAYKDLFFGVIDNLVAEMVGDAE